MTRVLQAPQRSTRRQTAVRLLGLGTATPAHLSQEHASQLAEPLSCDSDEHRQFLHRIYSHSGVQSRGSVLVDDQDSLKHRMRDFYRPRTSSADHGPTTHDRMTLFARFAPELAERSASNALQTARIDAVEVTHLIPVTCTGFFSPGLDVELIRRLGLNPSVQRLQIGFMGCHGAFNALSAARSIALADPTARILICCVELCTLHFAYGFHPQQLVANALFADGSAAAVVGAGDGSFGSPAILDTSTMLIPNSLDAMTWHIGDHGFEMTLSPRVPQLIGTHLLPWVRKWLAQRDMGISDIQSLAIHPGGPKVLTAATEALGIPADLAAPSRQILAAHGNMSSATILFVLQHLTSASPTGRCLALGFGPGLTAEGMMLEFGGYVTKYARGFSPQSNEPEA